MIASLPHFYKAESLLSGIASGLHPNKKDHGIEILLEHVSELANLMPDQFLRKFANFTVNWNTIVGCETITICLGSESHTGN